MSVFRLVPEDLYEDLVDYLTKHHDVKDGSDGTPRPNEPMRLTTELEQCRKERR